MNKLARNVRNLLFLARNTNYYEQLNKLILQHMSAGKIVAVFTHKTGSALGECSALTMDKYMLANLIVMHIDDIESTVRKMLSLHEWHLLPHLILFDLDSFLMELKENADTVDLNTSASAKPLMQQISLAISALFDYTRFLQNKRSHSHADSTDHTNAIVVLSEHSGLSLQQLELLINLYFYDDQTVFSEPNALQALLLGDSGDTN